MLPLFLAIGAGWVAGLPLAHVPRAARIIQGVLTFAILAVVWAQGLLLGADPTVRAQLSTLLLEGILFGIAVSVGAVLTVHLWAGRRAPAEASATEGEGPPSSAMRTAALLLFLLVLGVSSGLLAERWAALWMPLRDLPLLFLLFVIGVDLGRQRREVARQLRRSGPMLLVAPLSLLGSVLGALAVAPLLPHDSAALLAGAVGSGFYSLTGPLVASLDGPASGGVVFLGNLLRELGAMILIPVLARAGVSAQASAAFGGATAMDSSLPFLVRAYGAEGAAAGLATGILLSIAVPFLVPAVFALIAG